MSNVFAIVQGGEVVNVIVAPPGFSIPEAELVPVGQYRPRIGDLFARGKFITASRPEDTPE